MRLKLTFSALAVAILFSCDSLRFDTKIEYGNGSCVNAREEGVQLVITNTSKSKYLEVTIKIECTDGIVYTKIRKIKPGEILKECEYRVRKTSVVGEREIAEN